MKEEAREAVTMTTPQVHSVAGNVTPIVWAREPSGGPTRIVTHDDYTLQSETRNGWSVIGSYAGVGQIGSVTTDKSRLEIAEQESWESKRTEHPIFGPKLFFIIEQTPDSALAKASKERDDALVKASRLEQEAAKTAKEIETLKSSVDGASLEAEALKSLRDRYAKLEGDFAKLRTHIGEAMTKELTSPMVPF